MKKQSWLVLLTAAGLLGTTAVAGADGLMEKVKGILRPDISVAVDGSATALHPVYIDGKAYLPVRHTAAALGYDVNWNGKTMGLSRQGQTDGEAEQYLRTSGVIVSTTKTDSGGYRLEVLGHSPNSWIMLTADKDTAITDRDGKTIAASDLKAGTHITAAYGPIIAMSFPGQSHAASIQAGEQRFVKEEPVYAVNHTADGWQLQFSELDNGVETPTLTLTAGKETMVLSEQGQSVDWNQIKPGTLVRAYYGPVVTKSIPPQSPADLIVVTGPQLDQADVLAYRELAWTFVPASEKPHLLTKQDEAQVSIIDAKGAAVMPADDKQKKALADIQDRNGQLIAVNYSTDQDALLGPLTVVINPDTKELVGFFQRM